MGNNDDKVVSLMGMRDTTRQAVTQEVKKQGNQKEGNEENDSYILQFLQQTKYRSR
ncbi:MAG: hypothetical protein L6V95_12535 [Candidatus Melainabacteria bacterium]|nr:MAG: hypothetical protein L6V95_12535 [Candidatus Melainabacteria bacterium]